MKKDIIITALLTFCLTATLFMIATTRSQEYNPWSDLNGDGKIDMLDVVGVTGDYATAGDPTKNVTITNWPTTNQQTVFWKQNTTVASVGYDASGFGHIHITWYVTGLNAIESVTLEVRGKLLDPAHPTTYSPALAQSIIVTTANWTGALTIPVPSEAFYFRVSFGGTTASVNLAFYLTYT